jgi:hypothetical protein
MKRIVLISCAAKEINSGAKGKNIYITEAFKKSLDYAYLLKPDKIFFLTLNQGLIGVNEELFSSTDTLDDKEDSEIMVWADEVLEKLMLETDLQRDEFIFLAGHNYRKYLIPHIKNFKISFTGQPIYL